jgi:hypothetical protein
MRKSEGPFSSVLVAIVVALIAGSSAPWWWEKVFPPSQKGGIAAPDPSPAPLTPAGVGACASGLTASNDFHNASAPNGSWDWNCDGRIERQWGTCEALTREQCDPHTNATGAPPGFCTELRAPGGCAPKLGECGQAGWIYPCFYNPADGRCHAGGYETATTMACR